MKTLLPLLLSLFVISSNAQEYDKNWIIGQFVSYDGSIVTFNDNSTKVLSQKLAIEVRLGGVSMSNREGQIQFYSNGTAIASAIDHKLMKNGRGLSPGSDGEDYDNSGYQIVPRKSFLAFPDSEKDNIYYLVYSYIIKDKNYLEISDFLQIAKVDMRKNDGKGEVVYKNKILFNQKTVNKFDIVKHANGRDLWLLTRDFNGNEFTSLLLKNDSVTQTVISSIDDMGLSLKTREDSIWYNGLANFQISPNGNKVIDFYGKNTRRLFSFDRCTGALSILDTIKVDIDNSLFIEGSSPAVFTFSPNGKYLYGWNTSGFIQWDTESENISASAIRLGGPTYIIESNGNIYTRNSWVPTGGQLAPDGRIYYMFNWSQYVINNPDERCPDCGFCYAVDYPINGCLDGFDIPYGSTPFFPNFRLGPVDGSVCDTLGIDNIPLAKFRNERPDTTDLYIQFKDLTAYEPTDWTWSFGDGNSSTLQNPSHDYTFPGIYTVCLTASNENGGDTACKDIDLRTSGVENTQTTNIDALVYPNPSNGFIQIGLPPSTGPLKFTLFDTQGKKTSFTKNVLPQQIVPLSESISSGLYIYTIRDKKGGFWSGKVHIK